VPLACEVLTSVGNLGKRVCRVEVNLDLKHDAHTNLSDLDGGANIYKKGFAGAGRTRFDSTLSPLEG
jgi:hypothetical protein